MYRACDQKMRVRCGIIGQPRQFGTGAVKIVEATLSALEQFCTPMFGAPASEKERRARSVRSGPLGCVCTKSGAECTPRELRGPISWPFRGPRSSRFERVERCCVLRMADCGLGRIAALRSIRRIADCTWAPGAVKILVCSPVCLSPTGNSKEGTTSLRNACSQ